VDGAPGLELSDLGVAELCRGTAVVAGQAGQFAFDRVDGAGPELGDECVPGDLPGMVVAVEAERGAGARVAVAVHEAAGQRSAVRAGAAVTAGPARAEPAVPGARLTAAVGSGVHEPEGRRGQGEEGGRVGGDGVGHALAAAQAGGDEVVGVPPVDLGAGGAD
jgi:hypothetical protein